MHRVCCRCLEAVPTPHPADSSKGWWQDQPCIAVALLHPNNLLSKPTADVEYATPPTPQWRVQLYSLQRHSYFHHIALSSRVLGLKCSRRVLAVALENQVSCSAFSWAGTHNLLARVIVTAPSVGSLPWGQANDLHATSCSAPPSVVRPTAVIHLSLTALSL